MGYLITPSLGQQIAGLTPGGHNYRGCSNPLDTINLGIYTPQDAWVPGRNYMIVTPQDTIRRGASVAQCVRVY